MSTPSAEFGNRPLDQWKVTELKDELRRRRITTKGLKEDLIRRLEEAIRSDGENVNPGNGQQGDSYGSDKKERDSVQDYYPGQNPHINDGSVPFQKNLNFNMKEEDESVAEDKTSNLDVSGEIGTAKGSENDYSQDNKVVQEMVSTPKPSESNNTSSHRALADVDGEEPESEVQGIDDASGPRIKDAVPEESDSLHQVSEKVSPVVGFQLKCESVSTDSVSINEENELKDSLNADNVHLESLVKHRMKQESSDYVPHQGGDSRSLEEQVQAGPYQTEEGGDADDDDEAIDVDSSLKDDRIGQDEVRSPYIVDVTGNVTDESLNEDSRNLKRLQGADEMESKNEEDEIPQVNSAREEDAVVMELCQERKEKGVEDRGNDVGALGEKRKKEDLEAGFHEPAKRQRRWNSGNNLAVEVTKFTTTERERDLPRTLETAHSSPSTAPITRDRPSIAKSSMSRSDSMNNGDEQKERVVLPSQRPPTNSLRIDRFLRPFTLKAVQELLAKTGTATHFWMDHIKTHCYVTYSSVDEAITTRNALYNLQWPSNGGRQLIVEYVDPEEVKLKIEGPPPSSPAPGPVNAPALSGSSPYNHMPFKPPTQVTAAPLQHALLPPPPPPPPPPVQLPPPPMPPPSRERLPLPPKKVEQPVLTLDDLFKKTRASPRIYYLPLSEEEVAAKLAAKGKNRTC